MCARTFARDALTLVGVAVDHVAGRLISTAIPGWTPFVASDHPTTRLTRRVEKSANPKRMAIMKIIQSQRALVVASISAMGAVFAQVAWPKRVCGLSTIFRRRLLLKSMASLLRKNGSITCGWLRLRIAGGCSASFISPRRTGHDKSPLRGGMRGAALHAAEEFRR